MSINVSEKTGESVYTERPFEERALAPLYRSVRELVIANSKTGKILDLGCSDGVATAGLEFVNVVGIDLNQGAIVGAELQTPGYTGVNADLLQLPFSKTSLKDFDTAILLDVLEHVKRADSVKVLENLRQILPEDHTVIVSMPIISPVSIETWREGLTAAIRGERPPMGLFDRTHEVLTTARGHHKIFAEAGYEVDDEFTTNHLAGVTGDWDWKPKDFMASTESLEDMVGTITASEIPKTALLAATRGLRKAYFISHHSNSRRAQAITEALIAYQGIYVLKPADQV